MIRRHKASLSHHRLFTCDLGRLVPIACLDVLPGDSFDMSSSVLLRCSPLLAPVMHPVDVRVHHWFVPYRLLWEHWEQFITGGPDGTDASVFPTFVFAGSPTPPQRAVQPEGSLADYLGIPGVEQLGGVSALPFRAYAKIWNDCYRDQELQSLLNLSLTDGVDATTNDELQSCAWEKDYLTLARPTPQKGPDVTIPVDDPIGVETLREAFALQRFEEARSRFGSRYTEYLRALGVQSSDARLQRAEYLGGGTQVIQFSEVLQTGPGAVDGTPTFDEGVGYLKGHGIAAMRSNHFRKFFEEHGVVLSLLSVRPKTIYMDGVEKMWLKRDRLDFYQPELQHLGQQEVDTREVYAGSTDGEAFGFVDRFAEYRKQSSYVSGNFRSSLNFWHFARSFGSEPALNGDFVNCVPSETPFAVNSEHTLWCLARNRVVARRIVGPAGPRVM